jgi:hypothetical protein
MNEEANLNDLNGQSECFLFTDTTLKLDDQSFPFPDFS